jgi:anti-anti-sigma regulatory factor
LCIHGIANIASAFAGGFVGHISVSRTLVSIAAGGGSRLVGILVGFVALAVLVSGTGIISLIPRFVLAGLLLQLGARLIWDWAIYSRRSLPLLDWLVIVAIVLITSNFGFLQALLFGMLAGCVIFAVDVSRIRVIRHQFGLNERSSSLVRSLGETAFLSEFGGQVQVLQLSGYLFFGSAYSVLERVTALVTERRPQQVIFDFSGVTGIDSSAGASFAKIRDLLKQHGIRQAMVAMSPLAVSILSTRSSLDESVRCPDNLDTALEEAEEAILATSEVPVGLHRSMVDWLTEVVGSREHAQALFKRMTPAIRDSGSYLCRQGDLTNSLLFIERGPVSVTLEMRDQPPLRVRVFGAHTLVGWRAVDHEGEVLEVFATKRRDRKAALAFLKRAMKRYGRPQAIVTDRLRSYGAAMTEIGAERRQVCGRWLNNRAENSHQPFRRREGAMARFRDIKTLQKFTSAHASIHNHFNHDRHLSRRAIFKENRSAALAEWRQLAA